MFLTTVQSNAAKSALAEPHSAHSDDDEEYDFLPESRNSGAKVRVLTRDSRDFGAESQVFGEESRDFGLNDSFLVKMSRDIEQMRNEEAQALKTDREKYGDNRRGTCVFMFFC